MLEMQGALSTKSDDFRTLELGTLIGGQNVSIAIESVFVVLHDKCIIFPCAGLMSWSSCTAHVKSIASA